MSVEDKLTLPNEKSEKKRGNLYMDADLFDRVEGIAYRSDLSWNEAAIKLMILGLDSLSMVSVKKKRKR